MKPRDSHSISEQYISTIEDIRSMAGQPAYTGDRPSALVCEVHLTSTFTGEWPVRNVPRRGTLLHVLYIAPTTDEVGAYHILSNDSAGGESIVATVVDPEATIDVPNGVVLLAAHKDEDVFVALKGDIVSGIGRALFNPYITETLSFKGL